MKFPAWLNVVAMLAPWIGIAFMFLRYKQDQRKALNDEERRRKERDAELESMAERVIERFLNRPERREFLDKRIREVAITVIDDVYTKRAPSFVSVERYNAEREAMRDRLVAVEDAIRSNTKELGNIGGQIATTVAAQVTAFLSTKIVAGSQ